MRELQDCVICFVGRESGETNIYKEIGHFTRCKRRPFHGEVWVKWEDGWIVLVKPEHGWFHIFVVALVVPLPDVEMNLRGAMAAGYHNPVRQICGDDQKAVEEWLEEDNLRWD